MKLFFPLIFFCTYENTVKLSSVVSRKTDLKPWVNMVSVKSIVVNKVREHVNNSLTNFPSFPATGKFVLRDYPFTLYDNSKNIVRAPFTKKGLYAR
jgi:hypothetical protein